MQTSCAAWQDPDTGDDLDQANKDLCELTLIALHFKHNIQTKRSGVDPGTTGAVVRNMEDMEAYVRCILVNIFMKKIIGKKCLQTPGGKWACGVAHGIFTNLGAKDVGNIECERKDAGEGGQKGISAKDRDFWQITDRWFTRNMQKINDGDTGILGEGCMVQKQPRKGGKDEHVGELKKKVQDEIKHVEQEIKENVQKILKRIEHCTTGDSACVKNVLDKEQEEATNKNETPPETAAVNGKSPDVPTTPSSEGRATTTSSSRTPADPGSAPAGPAPPSGGRSEDVVETPPPSRPLPPAPPPAEGTGAGNDVLDTTTEKTAISKDTQTTKGQPDDPTGETKCPEENSRNTASSPISYETSNVRITPVSYTYEGALTCANIRELEELDKKQRDLHSGPKNAIDTTGRGTSEDTKHKDSQEPVSDTGPGVGTPASSAPTPKAPSGASGATGTTGAEGSPAQDGETGPSGPAGKDGAANPAEPNTVDGGNDDPPPLNPPKPNPNPDQSGSSGSFSDADLADGVSGGEGTAGGGGPTHGGPGGAVGGGTRGSSDAGWDAPTPATPYVPPGLTWENVKPYTPAIIPAVVGIGVIAFFLWKYFAHLGKQRRRTYRTVRNVPSPPLDEEILEHLQRGAPPPDYGYTMLTDRQPASTSDRRRRHPRVHRRTIIELHLEVLNECEAAAWETVKDDYWKIVVQECARDLQQDAKGHSSFPDTPSTNQDLSRNNVSSILNPSTDSDETDPCVPNEDDPWSCMENIRLAADPCGPHACDPCSCMETIQLETDPGSPTEEHPDAWSCMENIDTEAEQNAHSDHGDDTLYCTQWINWIDCNKLLLQECTTQPWFLQLTADWKQYLRDHMAENDDNGQRARGAPGNIPYTESKKLEAWKEWVAQQHRQICMYGPEEWFQHLLNNVHAAAVSPKGAVPAVDNDLEVEKVMATEHMLRMQNAPRTQLHQHLYMKKPLTAKIWILILALVIEQCEVERSLQEKELCVDDLLEQL
ncbi:hypothetical protein AK88_04929 [Plasmodium fragile]|uniref:Schizont-infected cell agglutination C-terminal domain-containing protein n=1 Tax=Plasmodium fragile TaxID=5857 RepID=A0A0D9QI79_PLAFR|nr:uncharacterized protein AK88_04929 [Plasmodium fragile]KJP85426.1 hypothetical protein AK88_04929 [Plasmodium fragile]